MIDWKNCGWLIIILLAVGCGDDEVPEPVINPIGDCHYLFDVNGQGLGVLGACAGEDHWSESLLLSQEFEWLSFIDSIAFTDNYVQFSNVVVNAYPIPAATNGVLNVFIAGQAGADQVTKFKATIVDQNENVIANLAQTLTVGSNNLAISLEGVPAGRSYRLYYLLTDTPLSIYHQGYGDFFICDDPINYTDCL